ncbi:PREDICTED: uncharacterized protein LOC108546966 [Eufriesea mexicana]|uniref:uncharacterized protein LOC108546966 n=1 Tax=Eufriesea mexicana TaxID=516756 RepID=UPI00083BFC8B|nr:PREDICTED: uncharacterized protein LOC108546966 [Eufriesea mexicana]
MTKTRNEPLYIFTDSLDEKFFLIDFSTFQVSTDITGSDDDEMANAKIRLKGNKDCLNIEKHNFFRRPEKCGYLISIVTAGTKATVMEIDRGRHLLRVYCHSESGCFLTISSDTVFHVGDKKKMYELMCTESEMVDKMAKHISNSLSSAYQAFGTQRYPEALKVYYNSYLPPIEKRNKINKMFYNQIHDYFIDEQVQLIKKIMPEEEVPDILRSLRIFFVNHTIGLECFTAISMLLKSLKDLNVGKNIMEDNKSEDQHSTDEMDGDNKAAVVIQSFFKMITIRKYAQIHNPRHEQHDEILQNLLKVVELFNYNERESLANQILRNILKHHDKLYDIYFCSNDFEYTLQTQELRGTLTNVRPNQWLPMVRLVVNPQDSETVFACIDLFVGLPKYSVRVFKNQTGKEILRVVNNVVPHRYTHVKLGFTIFCYGWSEDQASRELPWSFHIVTMKGQPVFNFLINEVPLTAITTPPVLLIEELSDNYIPNSKNYISKWILRAVQPCVVSFRLRVSYEKVRMTLRVTDEEDQVLSQVKGISVVILPMVYLELRSKSEETVDETKSDIGIDKLDKNDLTPYRVYYVEASVLDNSWPLTRKEWSLVSEFKVKPTGSLVKTKIPPFPSTARLSKTESLKLKKSSKQSVNSVPALQSPYWVLQVVTDSGSGLEISQDRTKEKEIARMKEAWAKENPDSLQRGRELREAFIKKHEMKPKSLTGSLERKDSSHSEKSLTKRDTLRSSIVDASEISMAHLEERTLKPPSVLRRLPPLDLTIYEVREDEEDKPWVKTELDEDMLRNIRMMNIIYAQEDYKNFLEDLENLYKQQKHQYQKLYGRYKDSFLTRRSWFASICEIRRSYIGGPRAEAVSNAKSRKSNRSNNNTKSKKSQRS